MHLGHNRLMVGSSWLAFWCSTSVRKFVFGGCHVRLPVPRGEVILGHEAVIIIEARLPGMLEPFWWHRPVGCCRRGVTPGSRPCLGRRPGDGEGTGGSWGMIWVLAAGFLGDSGG